jgi:hypothetical protein
MWGYPLWLFLGLWVVIATGPVIERARLNRIALAWCIVTALYAVAFVVDNGVLPFFHRYRAAIFPGDRLGAVTSTHFRAATGEPLRYVIGADLKRHGAVVVWDGGGAMPPQYARFAAGAQVQPPLTLPWRWGHGESTFGWAIVPPQK